MMLDCMGESQKKKIIISAINLYQGGTFSVLVDCLTAIDNFNKSNNNQYEIFALVHSKSNLPDLDIQYLEYPKSRSNWFLRLYYEYVYFFFFSMKKNIFLWFSVHDMSPFVHAKRKVVYCHNPGPYYKATLSEGLLDPTFYLFTKFYKLVYQFNIKSNNYVIVQQDWIRNFFIKKIGVKNVIVAYPDIKLSIENVERLLQNAANYRSEKTIFFYPAIPRVFKNFEIIYEAVAILKQQTTQFQVLLTYAGNENKYAKKIQGEFGLNSEVQLLGEISRDEVYSNISKCDCLLFPSKLETWGLPISEAKLFHKPILAADLPYAKETVGDYDKVCFFDPNNALQLANLMLDVINKNNQVFTSNKLSIPEQPFVKNWNQLIEKIIE